MYITLEVLVYVHAKRAAGHHVVGTDPGLCFVGAAILNGSSQTLKRKLRPTGGRMGGEVGWGGLNRRRVMPEGGMRG